MDINDIISYIENLLINSEPVYPEMKSDTIIGLSQENKIQNEGVLFYDIRFFAMNPSNGRRIIYRY